MVSLHTILSGGLMAGILRLVSQRFQDRVQIEQQSATTITEVRNLATADPGENGVIADIKPFSQLAGINEDWRHRMFLPACCSCQGTRYDHPPLGRRGWLSGFFC